MNWWWSRWRETRQVKRRMRSERDTQTRLQDKKKETWDPTDHQDYRKTSTWESDVHQTVMRIKKIQRQVSSSSSWEDESAQRWWWGKEGNDEEEENKDVYTCLQSLVMSCVWTWEIIAIKWMFSPEAFKKQLNKFIALLLLVDDCVWPLVLFSSSFFFLFHNIPHNTCSLVFNPSLHTLLFSFAPFPVRETQKWGKNKSKESWESWGVYSSFTGLFYLRLSLFSLHSKSKCTKGRGQPKKNISMRRESCSSMKDMVMGVMMMTPFASHWTPLWSNHMIMSLMFFLRQKQQGWVRQTDFQG